MKKYLPFLLFLAFSTAITAQSTPRVEQLNNQKRRETYVNRLGYDSIQFTISSQKDTILRAFFADNGRLWRQVWADSTRIYDAFGQLREVYYTDSLTQQENTWFLPRLTYEFDGSLATQIFKTPTGEWVSKEFNRKNALVNSLYATNTPSVNYTLETNAKGLKTHGMRSEKVYVGADSMFMYSDTTFYDNGQVFSLSQNRFLLSGRKNVLIQQKYYAKNGALLLESLPDSLALIPFKDNVDCYYGLKNQRGDTIYTPRFDQIKELTGQLWKVEEGPKVLLMQKDGKIMSSIPMDNIEIMTASRDYGGFETAYYNNSGSDYNAVRTMQSFPQYLHYKKGHQYGIIDRNGTPILPPQYPTPSKYDATGSFFELTILDSTNKYDTGNRRVIDRQGKYVFENRYPQVELTGLDNFFRFSNTPKADTSRWHHVGLVDKSGGILLDDVYSSIVASQEFHLFWVFKGKEIYESDWKTFKDVVYGLFDPVKKQWVLPCVYRGKETDLSLSNIVLTDTRTQKQGIIAPSGQIILPFVYDTIIAGELGETNLMWAVAQNGRYQLYDVIKQTLGKDVYQHLAPALLRNLDFGRRSNGYDTRFFIAQKNNKWGFITENGAEIVPFDYDYAGDKSSTGYHFTLVKGNQATLFSDWFFPLPDPDKTVKRNELLTRPTLISFKLVGNKTDKVFSVNKNNRVLYPPQYRALPSQNNMWTLLENDAKERLLLFNETELSLPFPYKQQLLFASEKGLLGILRDEDRHVFEVVNLKTHEKYRTISNGAIAADQASGTFFVKSDTLAVIPNLSWLDIPHLWLDTLILEDANWQMFDATGKPLTTNTFRYPIAFLKGVGIGTVGDKFGVWRADGSTVVPPQYKNARWDANYDHIVLYQNIGLKNWVQLLNPTGKTLIGTGRYDGISEFYGEYALVSLGDKIGLVDTNGREIIAPMSLHNDTYNLMDSLTQSTLRSQFSIEDIEYYTHILQQMPISVGGSRLSSLSPDSLHLPNALRNRVWHYLLETQVQRVIQRADVFKIQRAKAFKTYNAYRVYQEASNYQVHTNTLQHIFVDSSHISFTLVADSAAKSIFKNYFQTKTGWEQKQLSDILNLSRDNIIKINNLMREKIKVLENKDIDCGESTSFVERAQNTFLAHAEGISFYFTSGKRDNYEEYGEFHYVPILLNWAELKAFRTPQ